ncbi:cation:dicarboxylase symporter family transporter [candidate division KSB1 bacterium]|nr:cation:dicarboxylase symporter family transporter [candidate division KSB1 bacterium]
MNLTLEGIGIITAVDRILDRCRTTMNVWGDRWAPGLLPIWKEKTEME